MAESHSFVYLFARVIAQSGSFGRIQHAHIVMGRRQDVSGAPSLARMSRCKRYTRNLGRSLPSPSAHSTEWVRFEHASEGLGVFSYVADAERRASARLAARIERLSAWFERRLDAPIYPSRDDERFWFRAEALDFVGHARELADLVARAGYPMREVRMTERVGWTRWEDAHQIALVRYGS